MEKMEIMENENVIEAAEEIAKTSGKGWKIAAGLGLTAIVGVLAYRYAYKPISRKIKAKKESKHEKTVTVIRRDPDDSDIDETDEQ